METRRKINQQSHQLPATLLFVCSSPDSLAIDSIFPFHLSIQFFIPTLPRHPYRLWTSRHRPPRFPTTLQFRLRTPIVVDRMAGAGGSCISAGVNDALQACCVFAAEDIR